MKRRTPAFHVLLVHVLLVLVLLVLVLTGLVMSIPMKGKESPFKPELHDDEKRSVESEEEVNNNEDLNLYEGDIVLDVEDEELVDLRDAGDVDGPLNTVKRNAMRNRYSLWLTKIVPYLIDGSSIATYSKTYNAIQQALSNYNQQTCISWRPRHLHSTWHYVKFVKKPGCWSRVGRVPYSTGFQEISIGPGCESIGTVMHEMMHALGFWHAQSRPDRNQAVEILWENIIEGKEHNFNKYNHEQTDVLGLPYDFDSVMHYSNKAFTKNGKNTIQKIGDPTASFGQRIGFSNNDKLQLYKLYSCGTAYGGWSLWSTFTPCDSSCKKKRMRFYTGGVQTQEVYCTSQECYKPVEGHWGRWSAWGSCSKTCDFGVKSRYRLCDDPTPKYGGAACSGQSTQSQNCLVFFCNAGPDDCQFENPSKPYCDWTQDTNDNNQKYFPDWIRISGSTPSPGTGPTGDHTIGTGYYIYGEASQCSAGQVVRLLSKEYQPTNGRCMTFWYNMYGEAMGALNIYVQPKGASGKKIFTKSGNQGTKWMNGKALIQSSYNYKLVLEMVCGSSYQGDIAVDDITFQNRAC